jgi:hypothetical protein
VPSDKERIKECVTAKDRWNKLKKRYQGKRPALGRQYLDDLVNYRMPEDGNIQDAWVEVQRLTRHVKAANPEMRSAFNQEQMFQRLLRALPPVYDMIRHAIDGQGEQDVDVLLQRLLDKESFLKSSEKASSASVHHANIGQHVLLSLPNHAVRSTPWQLNHWLTRKAVSCIVSR